MKTQFRMFHGGTFQMRWQASLPIDARDGEIHRVGSGKAMHFGRQGGELSVVEGQVWLTRDSELGDHVIEPGQRVRLAVADNAVIEPLLRDQAATVRWNPRRQSFVGVLFAAPLRGLAFAAGLMATGFAALARSAASMASRAQGCISTGDSMASSGALK